MIRSSTTLLRAPVAALLLASGSMPALASAAFDEQPAAAPAADAADSEGMDAIVVTATKRETNLQETPISMAVVDTQALEDRHVQSMYDFADGAVPSLRVATRSNCARLPHGAASMPPSGTIRVVLTVRRSST